jgi:hypothetical protein
VTNFNLDTFEREDAVDLFTVTIGARDYILPDAKGMDYRDAVRLLVLIKAKEVDQAIELLLSRDDREAFFANNLPIFRMEELFVRYKEHYGITEQAAGEVNASSPS